MVELVDSVDLGSTAKSVQVRVLLPAPNKHRNFDTKITVLIFVYLRKNQVFSIFMCEIQSRCGSERDFDFLFMHGHDFSLIPSWKIVILSRRAPPKQVILQIQNTRRYSYETER